MFDASQRQGALSLERRGRLTQPSLPRLGISDYALFNTKSNSPIAANRYLRTWDRGSENGAVFINFNPVQNKSWTFKPGQTYSRRYRVYVYDGTLSMEQAEVLWRQYAQIGQDPEGRR